jgi:transposase
MKNTLTEGERQDARQKIRDNTVPEGDCWRWMLYIGKMGYGMVGFKNHKYYAHRLSYIAFYGPTQEQMDTLVVRHSCHRPWCVNPRHLSLGTQTENMEDCRRAGRLGGIDVPILSDETVLAIVTFGQAGMSAKERAKKFDVNEATIYDIDKKRSYRNVTREIVAHRAYKKQPTEPFIWNEKTFQEAFDRVKAKCEFAKEPHKKLKTLCLLPRPDVCLHHGRMLISVNGKQLHAHIVACMFKEQCLRPEHLVTRHLCGVDRCCNPEHLEFGTRSKNATDVLEMNPSKRLKLNPEKVRSMRNLRRNGMSALDIAQQFGISAKCLYPVLSGKKWRHVMDTEDGVITAL